MDVTCTDRPAMSTLRIAWGIENPSYTGTAWVTPSPESSTIPVVRPDEYLQRDNYILSAWTSGSESKATLRLRAFKGGRLLDSQGEDGLDRGKEGRHVERLKEDLGSHVSVLTRIQRCFSQQDRVLWRRDREGRTRSVRARVRSGEGELDGRTSSDSVPSSSEYTHDQIRSMSSQSFT